MKDWNGMMANFCPSCWTIKGRVQQPAEEPALQFRVSRQFTESEPVSQPA